MVFGAAVLVGLVLLLTLFVYLGWLSESAVSIGNTVIKILTALLVGLFVGRRREGPPWWFGGTAAVLSLLLAVIGMSVYLGEFRFSWSLLADLLMSFAIGSAAAMVLLRHKTE